jgi:hypothetical protein
LNKQEEEKGKQLEFDFNWSKYIRNIKYRKI